MRLLRLGCFLMVGGVTAFSQETKGPDRQVTAFTLPNGMRFLVMERHQAPVVSFHTLVGGGSLMEPAGQTGLVHLLERLATKGSESIGTRNWSEEKKALEALDEAYERMQEERNKGALTDQERYETLRARWRMAVDSAMRFGQADEYGKILQENGATIARATGDWNSLQFGYTLPSNRAELWFAMESQRLMHPVVREFEKELGSLTEEQGRPLVSVQQRVLETLLSTAFTAHRYRVPRNGWPGDLAELNRAAARAFCEEHFVPGNIVAALVGDIDPTEAKRLAEKYFGPMPVRPLPPLPHTVEPVQQGPRTVALDLAGPAVGAIGYKRPSYFDKDDAAFDLLEAILVSGKSGLAYQELVQEKKLAQNVQVLSTFPDGRYPNLFVVLIHAAPGHTIEENQRALDELLNRLRVQKVEPEALSDAQTQVQARLYGRLDSNAFLAQMLAVHTSAFGDWKKMFSLVEDLEKVTQDDVMRVVQRYFFPSSRTTVFTGPAGVMPPRIGGVQ